MSIVYRPEPHHHCKPPRNADIFRNPRGTIWRCECTRYWVSDGLGRWYLPLPFGPTARRIRRIEKERAL